MQKLEDLNLTDDVSLPSHTWGKHRLARMTFLEINVKNQQPTVNASQKALMNFDGQANENVDLFILPGSIANKTGGMDEYVRLGSAKHAKSLPPRNQCGEERILHAAQNWKQ